MVRGIEAAGSGMVAQSERVSVLSNDIANTETPGFCKDDVVFRSFGDQLLYEIRSGAQVGALSSGVTAERTASGTSAGTYTQTGRASDLAVGTDGYFAVEDAQGGVKYTRNGNFSVDAAGCLALPTGERLLGQNGPVRVGGGDFTVASDGTVRTAAGQTDRIEVFAPVAQGGAVKRADGFFDLTGARAKAGDIRQGWLEGSNADAVGTMTGLMEATRAYQSCQQAFKQSDSALETLLSKAGQLRETG